MRKHVGELGDMDPHNLRKLREKAELRRLRDARKNVDIMDTIREVI